MASVRRGKKRGYHHGDLRRALLDAARAELHAVGHRALSLRSVARRAGVSHAAAYHHFKDKGALLLTIALEGFDHLDRCMAEAMEAAGADPLDRLVAAGLGYMRMAADDPTAYDLMFNGCEGVSLTDDEQARSRRSFERLLNAVASVRQAVARNEGDVLQDALVQWEMVHGLAMLSRSGQLADTGVNLEQHIQYATARSRAFYATKANV
jgi:AcrR family transcriptional regulator